jgi:DNA invertase Pin-like site-specific DNA recombinase
VHSLACQLAIIFLGFVSLTEAIDLTTPSGRALAGMLAVFAEFERDILRERVKAGIAQARENGKRHGRPPTATKQTAEVKRLFKKGVSKSEIARRLKIGRTSVIRILNHSALKVQRLPEGLKVPFTQG